MVGYRTHAEPSVIRRAAEMWPEGVEQMPYASEFVPPYPFPGLPSLSGGGNGSGSSGTSASAAPQPYDLTFVRGDQFSCAFLFQGVCWTAARPQDEDGDPIPDPVDPDDPQTGELPV